MCDFLGDYPKSPVNIHTRQNEPRDALIDVRAIYQQDFRDLNYGAVNPFLKPAKGRHGLLDFEKVFCVDQKSGQDIYAMRGIDPGQGCMIVVRPDQYVAQVLPLDDHAGLTNFFAGCLKKA